MKLETFFEIFLLGDHSMINGVFKGNFGGWNGQLMDELMIINFLFTVPHKSVTFKRVYLLVYSWSKKALELPFCCFAG